MPCNVIMLSVDKIEKFDSRLNQLRNQKEAAATSIRVRESENAKAIVDSFIAQIEKAKSFFPEATISGPLPLRLRRSETKLTDMAYPIAKEDMRALVGEDNHYHGSGSGVSFTIEMGCSTLLYSLFFIRVAQAKTRMSREVIKPVLTSTFTREANDILGDVKWEADDYYSRTMVNHGDNMFDANDFMNEAKLLSDIDSAIDPAAFTAAARLSSKEAYEAIRIEKDVLSKINTRIQLRKDEIATAITNRRYELLVRVNDMLESSEGIDKEYFEFLIKNVDINISYNNEVVKGYGVSSGFLYLLKQDDVTALKLEKKARKNSKSRAVSFLKDGEWVTNGMHDCENIERKIYDLVDQKAKTEFLELYLDVDFDFLPDEE